MLEAVQHKLKHRLLTGRSWPLTLTLTSDPELPDMDGTLTWVAIVEVILIVRMDGAVLQMPFLCIRIVVVLHQHTKEDDDDDLKDEAGDWQL